MKIFLIGLCLGMFLGYLISDLIGKGTVYNIIAKNRKGIQEIKDLNINNKEEKKRFFKRLKLRKNEK